MFEWLPLVALIGLGLLIFWAIAIYNRLVKLKNMVEEGWSGIDVQLKRRSNLIPNLIETVKGYMGHERELLEKVTELRSKSLQSHAPHDQGQLEGALSGMLGTLFAVAENYPDLKADANFRQLQQEISEIEDQIQLARRYYNGTVRNLNTLIESFPSNLVANFFRFATAEFFEIDDPAEKAVPQVDF
ncbi:MAG: LemA family protein [Alphaproteobacteria bacterium]|nr:LemA family protein [Alphaproteobacteria bacterium]